MALEDDPMVVVQSFLELVSKNKEQLARLGVSAGKMHRTLSEAMLAYRAAQVAGNELAMEAAQAKADRWLRYHMERVVAAVRSGPSRDGYA